jgi:hypothetical protein
MMTNTNMLKKTSHIVEGDNEQWLVFSEFDPLSYEHAERLLSMHKEHGRTYLPFVSFHKLESMDQANEKLKQLQVESNKRIKELSSNTISAPVAVYGGGLAVLGGALAVMLFFGILGAIKKGLFG